MVNSNEWFNAEDEIPAQDEVLCLIYILKSNEFEKLKYYDIGYIFADKWYDEREHELIEVNGSKVLYWTEMPPLPA